MKATIKNQITRVFIISGLLFLSTQLFAHETFSVEGKVVNRTQQTIKNAVVTLTNINTLEAVATGICRENGQFNIDNVPEGQYILTVQKDGISRAKSMIVYVDGNGNLIVKNTENHQEIELAFNQK